MAFGEFPISPLAGGNPLNSNATDDQGFESILFHELSALEGIHAQHPESGANRMGQSMLGNYSNRLHGCPYQLLDSVDRRFTTINKNLGNEYLRNFILNSPILYVRPGMPHYTGGDNPAGVMKAIQSQVYDGTHGTGIGAGATALMNLAKSTIFSSGSQKQKRMFGFRSTFMEYMMYVNYMCRSVAVLLTLMDDGDHPNGAFVATSEGGLEFETFDSIRWENYRLTDQYVSGMADFLGELAGAGLNAVTNTASAVLDGVVQGLDGLNPFTGSGISIGGAVQQGWDAFNAGMDNDGSIAELLSERITSVMFMVEPQSFQESFSNQTGPSFIEAKLSGITSDIGAEIAFITNSTVDTGVLGGMVEFLGSELSSASMHLSNLVQSATGGWATQLFQGGLKSIKGQKMLYPKIYRESASSMNYSYKMILSSPYGDIYNYYMNIVVPLCHLLCLVCPRMVTSNTVSSPFVVQAFIPGMTTCQLGIISQMDIVKNPKGKHVSVQGFPLTVEVSFTVEDLYSKLAVSPAHDPASFMFNETLNDYMANLAGLIPGIDTFNRKRINAWERMQDYLSEDWKNDIALGIAGSTIPGFSSLYGPINF